MISHITEEAGEVPPPGERRTWRKRWKNTEWYARSQIGWAYLPVALCWNIPHVTRPANVPVPIYLVSRPLHALISIRLNAKVLRKIGVSSPHTVLCFLGFTFCNSLLVIHLPLRYSVNAICGYLQSTAGPQPPFNMVIQFWIVPSPLCNIGLSKKMDGIWNRCNLKSTGRIYAFGVLKCSEKFKVLDLS